jgi:hypothetical protein
MISVLRLLYAVFAKWFGLLFGSSGSGSLLARAEHINIGDRRFRVLRCGAVAPAGTWCAAQSPRMPALTCMGVNARRTLGEGGYAFVYLAHEVPTASSPLVEGGRFAIKKVCTLGGRPGKPAAPTAAAGQLGAAPHHQSASISTHSSRSPPRLPMQLVASTAERLTDAKREIEVLQKLHHPNLLQLLDSAITTAGSKERSSLECHVHMLFPAYEVSGRALPTPSPPPLSCLAVPSAWGCCRRVERRAWHRLLAGCARRCAAWAGRRPWPLLLQDLGAGQPGGRG